MFKASSGIYRIVDPRGKQYIGSTNDFVVRKRIHFWKLKNHKHPNPILQAAFNKYGRDFFKFEIVQFIEPEEKLLLDAEQVFLDRLFECKNKLVYNVCRVAGKPPSWKGRKLTVEHKAKTSATMIGRTQSDEHKENGRIAKLGSQNPMSKLTEDIVREIRGRYKNEGITQASLGTEYGLGQKQVSYIVNRKAWAQVED